MALPTRIGKEVSTGTSTAAMIEAFVHGGHPVVYIVIIAGFVVAGVFHIVESKLEGKKNENNSARKSGVRDYGIIRVL